LAGKGVPSQIAEEAVREAYKEIDETDVARRLAFQRVEKGCDIRSAKGNRRLRDFLLRRGFSFETIGNALSAVAELSVQESSMQESVQDPSWSALRDEVHDT
jgi:SOS response regulatory protein OraA/RecX